VAWSLSDEAFFYLGFPLLQKRILRLGAGAMALVVAGSWTLSLGITSLYALTNPDHLQVVDSDVLNAFWLNAVKFHPLVRLPEFLLGMACGAIFLKSKRDRRFALPLILGGLAMCAAAVANSPRLPYPVLHTSLLAPAFAAIIYGFGLGPRWASVLSWRPFEFLGDASYSLYLLHSTMVWPFFYTQSNEPRHRTIGWIFAYLLMAVSVSGLVYRFIEEPARRKLRGKKKESVLPALFEKAASRT
jgi:peptidoglycan/LPS O-acetylase OafA/YrhL